MASADIHTTENSVILPTMIAFHRIQLIPSYYQTSQHTNTVYECVWISCHFEIDVLGHFDEPNNILISMLCSNKHIHNKNLSDDIITQCPTLQGISLGWNGLGLITISSITLTPYTVSTLYHK